MIWRKAALVFLTTTMLAAPVLAQEEDEGGMIAPPPNFVPQAVYSTKSDPNAANADIYSTKAAPAPSAPGSATAPAAQLPWQQQTLSPKSEDMQMPVQPQRPPMTPQQARYPAGYVPFGHASPEATVSVPEGPRGVTAAPVGDVGVSSDDLAPATAGATPALPPKDPTEPTAQTAPIFEDDDGSVVRNVVLRGLNKVTAQTQLIEGPVGSVMRFGNLEIIAKSCRASAKTSQEDYAALLEIRELKTKEQPKELFSGWMYASSPSVMALEHPVYDVSVVECKKGQSEADEQPKDVAKPPKDSKKKK